MMKFLLTKPRSLRQNGIVWMPLLRNCGVCVVLFGGTGHKPFGRCKLVEGLPPSCACPILNLLEVFEGIDNNTYLQITASMNMNLRQYEMIVKDNLRHYERFI
jgi:hypothetical protein